MPMCPPCSAAYDRWLDYRPPPPQPLLINPGVNRARDVVEARSARANDTYALIRRQLAGIRDNCAAGRHAPERTPR